ASSSSRSRARSWSLRLKRRSPNPPPTKNQQPMSPPLWRRRRQGRQRAPPRTTPGRMGIHRRIRQLPNPTPTKRTTSPNKSRLRKRRARKMATDVKSVLDSLGKMTGLEVVELQHAIEDEWGVTPAPPVAVAAAPVAGGGDGAAASE